MITKPAKITQRAIMMTANNLILGESPGNPVLLDVSETSVGKFDTDVSVAVGVLVSAGNINVIAGNGTSVVVVVAEGVEIGPSVTSGETDEVGCT